MGKLFLGKKVAQCQKKLKGGKLLRGTKRKNLFGSVPWANRYNLKFCRTFGRTILVTSGASKKILTKSHDYSGFFSLEKRRQKDNRTIIGLILKAEPTSISNTQFIRKPRHVFTE